MGEVKHIEAVPVGEAGAWAVYRDGACIAVRLTREDAWAFARPNGDQDVRPLYASPLDPERLRTALVEARDALNRAEVFVSSRQRMHPEGVKLHQEAIAIVCAAFTTGAKAESSHGA